MIQQRIQNILTISTFSAIEMLSFVQAPAPISLKLFFIYKHNIYMYPGVFMTISPSKI